MMKAAWPVIQPDVLVLDTRDAILHVAPLLQGLAERCEHRGAAHWLRYLMEDAGTSRRMPYLVLILRPEEHHSHSLSAEDVEAAALFFEYRILGRRTGAVATADAMGFGSVFAPSGQGTRVAAMATRALVERGADIVLASYEADADSEYTAHLSGWPGMLSALRHRVAGEGSDGERVADLIVRRKGLHAGALRWAAGLFASPHSVLGRTNFLASVLRDPELRWIAGVEPRSVTPALLGKTARSQPAA